MSTEYLNVQGGTESTKTYVEIDLYIIRRALTIQSIEAQLEMLNQLARIWGIPKRYVAHDIDLEE